MYAKSALALLFSLLAFTQGGAALAAWPEPDSFVLDPRDGTLAVISGDGRAPLAIKKLARVVYYSAMTYTRDSEFAKAGDRATILSTISCPRKEIKRVVVDRTDATRGVTKKTHQSDEGAHRRMLTLPWRPLAESEEREARVLCATYFHTDKKKRSPGSRDT